MDFVIIAVIVLIISGATYYLVKQKKNGNTCIGCPYGKECAKNKHSCSCTQKSKSDL